MFHQNIYYPQKALRPFISQYKFLSLEEGSAPITSIRDYPRTAMDMVFFFKGNITLSLDENVKLDLSSCAFLGQFDKGYNISYQQNVQALDVQFRPNGVYPLTKIPLKETFNNHISIADLMSTKFPIEDLYECLSAQPTDLGKVKVLEDFLLDIYQISDLHYRLDYGIQYVQQQQGLVSVQELCEKLNTNYKSLNRWFEKKVGTSPKRFIQLTRFKFILEKIDQGGKPDWMELVDTYNFHDQAHFVKEFKQFAGRTPTAYLAEIALLPPNTTALITSV